MTSFISKCWAAALCVVGMLVLGGCTAVSPYRDYLVPEPKPTQEDRFYPLRDDRCGTLTFLDNQKDLCFTASVERTSTYTLFFIEFDEQGRYYDRRQLDALVHYLARIQKNEEFQTTADNDDHCQKQKEKNNGVSIVTFVHGWRNNARYDNDNVQLARDILNFTYAGEAAGSHFNPSGCPREVVGVYVGWRGASTSVSDLPKGLASWMAWWELISVWDRKNTAQNVAVGSVRELFSMLKGYQDGRNTSDKAICKGGGKSDDLYLCMPVRHLIVGHSYGALIVNNAVTQQLLENVSTGLFTEAKDGGCVATPDKWGNPLGRALVRPYADLIVLLNPAVEGARYEPLQEAVAARARKGPDEVGAFCPNQKPVMVVLTSEKDFPTGQAFRAVRWASTLMESSSPHNDKYSEDQRLYIGREEGLSSVRTLGHNQRYHTHELMGWQTFVDKYGAEAPVQPTNKDPVDVTMRLLAASQERHAYAKNLEAGCDPKANLPAMESGLRDWRCKTKDWAEKEKGKPLAESQLEKLRDRYTCLADVNLSQILRSNSGDARVPGWSATFLGGSTITHIPDYPGSRGMDGKGAELYTQNSPYSPIWNVYVKDETIMYGHNDINFPRLLLVLQQLYHSVVLKSYAPVDVLKEFGEAASAEYEGKCKAFADVQSTEAE